MRLKLIISFISLLSVFAISATAQTAQTAQWQQVSGERQKNISGMVFIEQSNSQSTFLVIHDNKKKEQNHASFLIIAPNSAARFSALDWIGDDIPVDLEAVTSVPNLQSNYMAFSSLGRVYHFSVNRLTKTAELIESFEVPEISIDADFEAFNLQMVDGQLVALWADRGLDSRPARIFWSTINLENYAFSGVGSTTFEVPYPKGNTRHVSDLKVDESGGVFVSSASDPGNDGPFSSAVYFAGAVKIGVGKRISFEKSVSPIRLSRFEYHKIEAIEIVPGANRAFAFGTDDENLGAAIFLDS